MEKEENLVDKYFYICKYSLSCKERGNCSTNFISKFKQSKNLLYIKKIQTKVEKQ